MKKSNRAGCNLAGSINCSRRVEFNSRTRWMGNTKPHGWILWH